MKHFSFFALIWCSFMLPSFLLAVPDTLAADAGASQGGASLVVKVIARNKSNNVYLFEVQDLTLVQQENAQIVVRSIQNEPLLLLKVMKKFPERRAFAGGLLRALGKTMVLQVGERYYAADGSSVSQITSDRSPAGLGSGSGYPKMGIGLEPFYFLSSVNSKDLSRGGVLNLSSRVYAGLESEFALYVSSVVKTSASVRFAYLGYAPLSNTAKTLTQSSNFLTSFDLGVTFHLATTLGLKLYGAMDQDIFLYSASSLQVAQESAMVPTAGASLGWDLLGVNQLGMRLTGFYEYKSAVTVTDFTSNSGTVFGGKLSFISYKNGIDKYSLNIIGSYRNQGTNLTDQSETILGLSGFISL